MELWELNFRDLHGFYTRMILIANESPMFFEILNQLIFFFFDLFRFNMD